MAIVPTSVDKWIEQAKTFHVQKMCILALKGGKIPFSSHSTSTQSAPDANAMDVDTITLSKHTPTKRPNISVKADVFIADFPDITPQNVGRTRIPQGLIPRPFIPPKQIPPPCHLHLQWPRPPFPLKLLSIH